MKTYTYLLLTFFVLPWTVFAQQSINGYITKTKGVVYFHSADSATPVIMSAGSNDVSVVLNKLESFDAVRGTAEATPNGIILQSIDFVGLNRLIGRWQHPKAGVTFRTFSDVSIYSNGEPIKAHGNFKYAITPGTGDNWNFFLTDENQVLLSSLSIRGPNWAVMTFYDSKSGAVTGTLPLNRVKR